jgi:hypothetical protein
MQAKAALTQDYKNLGITDAEKATVRSYVQAALKDSDKRCGVGQWDWSGDRYIGNYLI